MGNSRRLEGQTAWISGATSGIGEAAAMLFAQEGARVAIVGRRLDQGRRVAEQIEATGGEALAIECDVGRAGDVAPLDRGNCRPLWRLEHSREQRRHGPGQAAPRVRRG